MNICLAFNAPISVSTVAESQALRVIVRDNTTLLTVRLAKEKTTGFSLSSVYSCPVKAGTDNN